MAKALSEAKLLLALHFSLFKTSSLMGTARLGGLQLLPCSLPPLPAVVNISPLDSCLPRADSWDVSARYSRGLGRAFPWLEQDGATLLLQAPANTQLGGPEKAKPICESLVAGFRSLLLGWRGGSGHVGAWFAAASPTCTARPSTQRGAAAERRHPGLIAAITAA